MIPFFQTFFTDRTFQIILGSPLALILLDILTGTFSASKQQTFDPKKLGAFMGKGGLWYVVGLILVLLASTNFGNIVVTAIASLATMAPLAYSTGASIIENILELLPQPVGTVASTVVRDAESFFQDVGAPIAPVRVAQPVSLAGPRAASTPIAISDPAPAAGAPIDQITTNVMAALPPVVAYAQQPRV